MAEFTLHSSSIGWVALGFGSNMPTADIFSFWKGSSAIILSRRKPNGFKMPSHHPHTNGILVFPVQDPPPPWAKISVSFSIPAGNIGKSNEFIFAQGNYVENPDSPSSDIGIHNLRGKVPGLLSESRIKVNSKSLVSDDVTFAKSLDALSEMYDRQSFCNAKHDFCIYGRRNGENVIFTIHTLSKGWAGFGLGSSMLNADIYVFWKYEGGYMLSRRTSEGYTLPSYNSNKAGISIVDLDVPAPGWANMALSFVKPIDYELKTDAEYIYAQGESVMDPSSEQSGFTRHYEKGIIAGIDFSKEDSRDVESVSDSNSAEIFHNTFCDFYAKHPGTTNMFCLYGRPVGENVIFTIHSSASGWIGMGIGSSMRNADMYIFWKNSAGDGFTVSRRVSDDINMPIYNADLGNLSIVPLDIQSPDWAQLSVSFSLPTSKSLHGNTEFIFAHSNSSVENPDSSKSNFLKHNKKGKITGINFLASEIIAEVDDNDDHYDLIVSIHGILMLVAWAISPFIGIFIARYLKIALGIWWYRLHLFFMLVVTGLFSISGFALIYSTSKTPLLSTGVHGKLGLSVLMIMFLQIILGFICNALWSPERESIPWYDKAHWWIGRIVSILGLINVGFGIKLYAEIFAEPVVLFYTYFTCIVLGIVFLIFGQVRFNRTDSKLH